MATRDPEYWVPRRAPVRTRLGGRCQGRPVLARHRRDPHLIQLPVERHRVLCPGVAAKPHASVAFAEPGVDDAFRLFRCIQLAVQVDADHFGGLVPGDCHVRPAVDGYGLAPLHDPPSAVDPEVCLHVLSNADHELAGTADEVARRPVAELHPTFRGECRQGLSLGQIREVHPALRSVAAHGFAKLPFGLRGTHHLPGLPAGHRIGHLSGGNVVEVVEGDRMLIDLEGLSQVRRDHVRCRGLRRPQHRKPANRPQRHSSNSHGITSSRMAVSVHWILRREGS